MKKQSGIWIDSSKAIIVTFTGKTRAVKIVESQVENKIYHEGEGNKGVMIGHQVINREKKYDERRKHQISRYLENVIENISKTDEIYVFGPAETKIKLDKMIRQKPELATKLKATETADSMTMNQVVRQIRDFYKL